MEFQTNTTISETHVQVNLRWDPGYIKTLPGVLKAVAIVSICNNESQMSVLYYFIFYFSL